MMISTNDPSFSIYMTTATILMDDNDAMPQQQTALMHATHYLGLACRSQHNYDRNTKFYNLAAV